MSDTISDLGKILTGHHGRDAVHVAVAPVVAFERLKPGEHIGLVSIDGADGSEPYHVGKSRKPIGIVDPYLKSAVEPGEQFWMFLYPMTITSLRHEWTHPSFSFHQDVVTPETESRKWIESFADCIDQTYSSVMRAAEEWLKSGKYTYDNTESYKTDLYYGQIGEFWRHYEIVTGKKVKDHGATFFTCSC